VFETWERVDFYNLKSSFCSFYAYVLPNVLWAGNPRNYPTTSNSNFLTHASHPTRQRFKYMATRSLALLTPGGFVLLGYVAVTRREYILWGNFESGRGKYPAFGIKQRSVMMWFWRVGHLWTASRWNGTHARLKAWGRRSWFWISKFQISAVETALRLRW
jgi:hypothetical protein